MTLSMDRPITRKRWRKSHLRWAGLGVAAIALVVLSVRLATAPPSITVRGDGVAIATVRQATFEDAIPLRGSVVPLETVFLDAVEGGRVERVLVEAGEQVKEGQPILELSNTALQLDVIQREALVIQQINAIFDSRRSVELNQLNNIRTVAEAEWHIKKLRQEGARKATLHAQGYVSAEVNEQVADELVYWEKIRARTNESIAKFDAWKLEEDGKRADQLGKMEDGLKVARSKLDGLIVRAPMSGQLTALDAKPGETKPGGQRLGQVSREGGYKLQADFDEYYVSRVRAGQVASMVVAGKQRKLTVTKVYPEVKNGRVVVDLAIDAGTDLRPGQTLQGKLALGAAEPALVLQSGAFLEESGGASVFVVSADGSYAERRPVRLGRRSSDTIEVLDGLKPDEKVVVSDYSSFKDKTRIDLR
ncbi:efflux RND transporter periplasmic adaptor subunit [Roseiterribacter gracilis]|uniref:ABC transporter permease n=1 Tax=Roseiterribacter gracilis TaxID=2812848 RepID=A0A8S8XIH3_9PROT|nr:ABC transporter permease [Rhodospirillales bacterium TMPK1]